MDTFTNPVNYNLEVSNVMVHTTTRNAIKTRKPYQIALTTTAHIQLITKDARTLKISNKKKPVKIQCKLQTKNIRLINETTNKISNNNNKPKKISRTGPHTQI